MEFFFSQRRQYNVVWSQNGKKKKSQYILYRDPTIHCFKVKQIGNVPYF